jgi:hypothetical protein
MGRPLSSFILSVLLLIGSSQVLWSADARKKDEAETPRGPVITPSIETTKFTSPLDAEGYVDFRAALNRELGRGVRPEDNAVIPYLKAMGPCDGNRELINLVLKELGQPAWQPGGLDFVTFSQDREQQSNPGSNAEGLSLADQQHREASQGPWTEAQYPDLYRLLQQNDEELTAIVAALKRPQWYRPLVRTEPDESLMAFLLPDIQDSRSVAWQLQARSNWHLGHGRLEPALEDLLTIHRQGWHLMHSGATLIEALVGISIEAIASHTGNVWATHPDQTPELIAKYRLALLAIPPVDNLTRQIDLAERATGLDLVQLMARGKGPKLSEISGNMVNLGDEETIEPLIDGEQFMQLLIGLSVDWNVAITTMNQSYDELLEIIKVESRAERHAIRDRLNARAMTQRQEAGTVAGIAKNLLSSNRRRGENFGKMLSDLLAPAVVQTSEAVDRTHMRRQALLTLLAAKEYQLRHGMYPESIEQLIPESLAAMPMDRYTLQPLRYITDGATLRVYSHGPNGKDDGGPPFASNERDDLGYADPPAK